MKQRNPAIQKAVSFINEMLEKGIWKPGDLLPSISQLASSAKVSTVPMWKAVHQLDSEGILEVLHGSGTRVKSITEEIQGTVRKGWLGLRDRIHKDVLSGMYPAETLMPSLKELRVVYGVSYPTLRKALDNLAKEGVIISEHRTFRVVTFASKKAHASIVLLGWSGPGVEIQDRTPWGEEFLRICENQCSRMKINLQIVRFTGEENDIQFYAVDSNTPVKINDERSVLGYLVWAESPGNMYRQVLNLVSRFKKPIAVLQEGSKLDINDIAENCKYLQVFSIATSSNAARAVASFLKHQGHNSIAYFSHLHRSDWSQARLHGLREVYSRTGEPASVYSYSLTHYRYLHEFSDAIKQPDQYLKKILPYNDKKNTVPQLILNAFSNLKNMMSLQVQDSVIQRYLYPLFNKAILINQCTAWVCCNDTTALMALDFLKKHSHRKISLIGFDDTFEAFRKGLTSYNFNIQALVQLMLNHVVNPANMLSSKRTRAVEIEGMLVERQTTFKIEQDQGYNHHIHGS
jgi:DNA-binding transcriptional regulator YhcF (GntR family)